jgi:diaminohydroxyphosphoribosylaminopyrimidine deaminase / 5-amino-6-(5-phosphoribosylamino)uracil reductase
LLADDSKLNCRCAPAEGLTIRQPRRIILDSSARTPLSASLWAASESKIIIVSAQTAPIERVEALRAKGADMIQLPLQNGVLPLSAALAELGKRGIQSVLVEGGSRVLGSFLDSRLADKVCAFISPRILGGEKSLTAIGGNGAELIANGLEIRAPSIEMIGSDVLITGALTSWTTDHLMPT